MEGGADNVVRMGIVARCNELAIYALNRGADANALIELNYDPTKSGPSFPLKRGQRRESYEADALTAAAVDSKLITTFRMLLSKGVRIFDRGGTYSPALQAAIQHANTEAVSILLDERGIDVNASVDIDPLARAAIFRSEPLVRLLLQHELKSGRWCASVATTRLSFGTTEEMAELIFDYQSARGKI